MNITQFFRIGGCILLALVLLPAIVFSEITPETVQEFFQQTLSLTDVQVTQLKTVFDERSEALKALIEKYKEQGFLRKRTIRDDVETYLKETEQLLGTSLTDEQKSLFQDRKKLQQALETQVYEEARHAILGDMAETLTLSDGQREQVRSILQEDLDKRQALIDEYQGKGPRGLKSFRDENRTLRQETEGALKTAISQEQLEAFRDYQDQLTEKIRKTIFK